MMTWTAHPSRGTVMAAAAALVTAGLYLAPPAAAASARASGERVLYSFDGPDGAGPLSGVTAGPGGVLYGTTDFGGRRGDGDVFSLTPTGSGYTERALVRFTGANGAKPGGTVVIGAHGDLFGETVIGGAAGGGTVFELVRAGSGFTEKVLHSFTGADGFQPIGPLVLDARGDLFGVTQFGGTGGQGVVYEMTPTANGYAEQVLHSFAASGGQPQAGITMAGNGTLYGTLYGFSQVHPDGTVFSIRPRKTGSVYTDLYNFKGGTDGANPFALLTVDTSGEIYGTTQYGGVPPGTGIGNGTVFALTPTGSGYTERVLHSFTRQRGGFYPEAPLLLTSRGDLYGTTTQAGSGCRGGCGTIFELTPASPGSYTFRLVYAFAGAPDGTDPVFAGLAAGHSGQMFGTTRSGGTSTTCTLVSPGCGTVYQITPEPPVAPGHSPGTFLTSEAGP